MERNGQKHTETDSNGQKQTETETLNHLTFVDINPDTKIIPNREKITETDGNRQKRTYTEIHGQGEMEEILEITSF